MGNIETKTINGKEYYAVALKPGSTIMQLIFTASVAVDDDNEISGDFIHETKHGILDMEVKEAKNPSAGDYPKYRLEDPEIIEWLNDPENGSSEVFMDLNNLYFPEQSDAIAFKLQFGGDY